MAAQRARKGAGLRLLTETVVSPSTADAIQALLAELPEARWHQYEPVNRDQARAGARLAFGRPLDAHYHVDRADVILSLDADFLGAGPDHVRHAREFAARRRVAGDQKTMNRLYMVETAVSITGPKADHRMPLSPREVEAFARAMATALGVAGVAGGTLPAAARDRWIPAVVEDLQAHNGRALVVAGETQPPIVHALAHAMNRALGAVGATVEYTEPVEADPVAQTASLAALAADLDAGKVELLLVAGANPAYTAPADLPFADLIQRAALAVYLGQHENETAEFCHWTLPEAHYLEAWGDARSYDGTVTLMQPLIAPLYEARSLVEVLAMFTAQPERTGHDIVRGYWRRALAGQTKTAWTMVGADGRPFADLETFWRTALNDGLVRGTALPVVDPGPVAPLAGAVAPPSGAAGLDLVFAADTSLYDGRFANNGWLQELSKPHSKITWDNVAAVSPRTAERLGVANTDIVELKYGGRTLQAPVWIVPGHADGAVSITLGYGRAKVGRVGAGVGFNAYVLRTSAAPWVGSGLEVTRTGGQHEIAATQHHFLMEGRNIFRSGTLAEYLEHPEFVHELGETPPKTLTLYPEHEYTGYKWGMAIDLTSCTGCNACVTACQAENNIAVVGKEQVKAGREMQWIRLDPYYAGGLDDAGDLQPAGAVHAVRERALRAGLPGGRHGAQLRGPERHGLQPLRGHALLLEQLPLQGAPVQLPALPGLDDRAVQAAAQPRRDGAQPRRDGEVHLLRAAHQRTRASPPRRRTGRSATARS